MKTKTVAMLLSLILSATVMLLAQGPPPPPDSADFVQHHVQFLTKLLSLTSAQQTQATTIFTTAATAAEPLHTQMKAARQSLAAAIKADDTATINTVAATIGGLVAQMTSIEATAQAAFYQILTTSQQSTLDAQQSSGGHGKDAPGGPGPGDPAMMGGPGPF